MLNVLSSSPRNIRVFKIFLILLVVLAAAGATYILTSQKPSEAANSDVNTWYRSSKGIRHPAGSKATIFYKKTNVWKGSTKAHGKYIWRGPNKRLEPGRQYIGCFFYQSFFDIDSAAVMDVYNASNGKVLHKYRIISNEMPGTSWVGEMEIFRRTCLAFYIPKSATKNSIELRMKLQYGGIWVWKTKISRISSQKNELSNQWLFKKGPDNTGITHSYGFTR